MDYTRRLTARPQETCAVDNFRFDITADRDLEAVLSLAFARHAKAVAWRADTYDDKPRLVLAWTDAGEGWTPLLAAAGPQQAAAMIQQWLDERDYGPEPDHDGSNGRGFRVYNDAWGHVNPYGWPAFVAVQPNWAWYGK